MPDAQGLGRSRRKSETVQRTPPRLSINSVQHSGAEAEYDYHHHIVNGFIIFVFCHILDHEFSDDIVFLAIFAEEHEKLPRRKLFQKPVDGGAPDSMAIAGPAPERVQRIQGFAPPQVWLNKSPWICAPFTA